MRRTIILLLLLSAARLIVHGANVYVEKGAPAPTREWFGPDYERAAGAFRNADLKLPTRGTEDGDTIFSRLVSVENFSLARNRTLPLDQRIGDTLKMQQSANQILKLYIEAANGGADVHREIAEQIAFSLRLSVVVLDLVDEFLPTVRKDEKYEVRMDGLRKLRMSTEIAFSGVEESLAEGQFYCSEDLSLLISAMAEVLPGLKRGFSEDFTHEIRERLRKRAAEFKKAGDVQAIRSMLKEVAQPGATDNPGYAQ